MFGRQMITKTEFYTIPAVKCDFMDDSEHNQRMHRMEKINQIVKENQQPETTSERD